MTSAYALLARELELAFGRGANVGLGLVFFMALVILFPFGLGPDLNTLSKVGPAVLWAGPLLSILLGLEKLFQSDEEDGTLDVYRMSHTPFEVIVFIKAFAHWISGALPLVAAAPFLGFMLAMDGRDITGCLLCLLVGTPALVFFGALAAALTVRVQRGGMLLAVLAIPFLVPALIFGVSASIGFNSSTDPFKAPFLLLCAFSLFSVVLCPIAGAAALKTGR